MLRPSTCRTRCAPTRLLKTSLTRGGVSWRSLRCSTPWTGSDWRRRRGGASSWEVNRFSMNYVFLLLMFFLIWFLIIIFFKFVLYLLTPMCLAFAVSNYPNITLLQKIYFPEIDLSSHQFKKKTYLLIIIFFLNWGEDESISVKSIFWSNVMLG